MRYAVKILFSAVSKAWKTLENEEGYKRCQEIVEEAKSRVDEAVRMRLCVVLTAESLQVFKISFSALTLLV